jgi:hypothetical protein
VPGSTDVIVVGAFSGQIRLGTTTLTSAGSYDGFAARLRRDGSAMWSGQWGGAGYDAMHAAAMLPDGSAFVVGGEMCNTTLCSGPISGCIGFWQRFQSVDTGGCNYAGLVNGTTASIRALAMEQVGSTIYVYAAGSWSGTSATPGLGAAMGDVDGFVLRVHEVPSMNPTFEWAHAFRSIYPDVVEDIALDGASNLVAVGWTAGSLDFGAGPSAFAGYDDAFVTSLDRTTGALGPHAEFGTGAGYDHAYRVVSLPSGDVAIAGYFGPGNILLGNVLRSGSGTHNGFLYSVAAATNATRWANAYDGDVDPGALHLSGSELIMTGSFSGGLPLDRGVLTTSGSRSAFVVDTASTTGATRFARASAGGLTECSDGAVLGSDGTLAWEIAHSGTLTVGGTSVGGADQDLALVVVTP